MRLVLVLFAITVVSFLFLHLIPGDPVAIRLGEHASPQQIAQLTHEYGLDRPWCVQLAQYLGALLHGDLGTSIADTQPVAQKLALVFSGDGRTDVRRDARRDRRRDSGRRVRGGAAALVRSTRSR